MSEAQNQSNPGVQVTINDLYLIIGQKDVQIHALTAQVQVAREMIQKLQPAVLDLAKTKAALDQANAKIQELEALIASPADGVAKE